MSTERREFIARMAARIRYGVTGGGLAIFDGVDVTAEVRAAAGLGATTSDELERTVVAYACTWNTVRDVDRSGQRVWRALTPESLAGIDPASVPLRTDHDGPTLGRFVAIEPDDYGLLTKAVYDDTAAGRQALASIRSGQVVCYSIQVAVHEAIPLAETRDGEPVTEVVRGTVLDAGPATGIAGNPLVGPADSRARILAVGGQPVDPAAAAATRAMRVPSVDPDGAELAAMSAAQLADEIAWFVGGDRVRELSADIDFEARRKDEAAGEQVRRIERAVSALRSARMRAESSYGWWLRHGRDPRDWRAFVDFDAEADEHDAYLREHLYSDVYRIMTAGVPPKVSLMKRLRDLATHGRNRR